MAYVYNLEIEQGIPYEKVFFVRDASNQNIDMQGWTAKMQFRPFISSVDVAIDASTENAKLIINNLNSSVKIILTELDTAALNYDRYIYDLELYTSSSKPIRLVQGDVIINKEVTR